MDASQGEENNNNQKKLHQVTRRMTRPVYKKNTDNWASHKSKGSQNSSRGTKSTKSKKRSSGDEEKGRKVGQSFKKKVDFLSDTAWQEMMQDAKEKEKPGKK